MRSHSVRTGGQHVSGAGSRDQPGDEAPHAAGFYHVCWPLQRQHFEALTSRSCRKHRSLEQEARVRIVIAMAVSVMVLSASTAQAQRPARPPAARTTDAWKVETTRSEMTDEVMVILSLDAVNKVQGTLFEVRPSLA